jgi:signal transduction histidine kinase/CheY-like chemotaxis protein
VCQQVRRSILLLVTAGLLPVIALGGTFGAITLSNERQAVEQKARTDARFAAALVAVKLQSHVRAIEMVARSPVFDDGEVDVQRFRLVVGHIIRTQPDWRTISVADPQGERIIDAPLVIGRKPHGPVVEPASLARVVGTGLPAIGNVTKGPKGGLAFAVRAPVLDHGKVRFVVSAVAMASSLRELLQFEPLPEGWRASVVDATGQTVAVSRDSPSVADGDAALVESWAPVGGTAWAVRITAPARDFTAPLEHALLLLAAAALICLLLIALLARILAQDLKHARRAEQAQLQSQRMEALGRLTGGVAHDFNNLLTPILGGLELIGRRTTDERLKRYVENAMTSAERAKSLVARLLAYSRKQSLTPKPVDVARLLHGMTDLINRSLTPSIRLQLEVPPRLPPARADQAQLELAILNLVINARDAMPSGGLLRISAGVPPVARTVSLAAAEYVYVEIADTGSGMDEATMRQAIEPFFTTKPAEKGTGLGLSMVHGFAAQSGGTLQLTSRRGEGTSAMIILPASDEAVRDPIEPAGDLGLPPGRILLIDDDEAVRRSTADMLKEIRQEVIEAGGVDEALNILAVRSDFDAIVTDFVMPDRSGGDLIRAAKNRWPGLPILLVTGYVSEVEELPPEITKLLKPFSSAELASALRQTLGV